MRYLAYLCVVLLLSGCTLYDIRAEEETDDYYPEKVSPAEVQYLETVQQPHKKIGRVEINVERIQKMSEVIPKLKREAAIIGGDAVTNVRTKKKVWKSEPFEKLLGNANIRVTYIADVVVFTKN